MVTRQTARLPMKTIQEYFDKILSDKMVEIVPPFGTVVKILRTIVIPFPLLNKQADGH